MTVQQPEPVPG